MGILTFLDLSWLLDLLEVSPKRGFGVLSLCRTDCGTKVGVVSDSSPESVRYGSEDSMSSHSTIYP